MATEMTAQERAELNEGTSPVLDAHQFDTNALHEWMQDNVDGYDGSLAVEEFNGGQSNPTYKLTSSTGTSYVLRRKPPGKLLKSAHAVDREYRAMSGLAGTGVPVPRTYGLCEDDSVIGTTFYIMEFIEGRVIWDFYTDRYSNKDRAEIFDSACDALSKLHCVDYRAAGLEDFGREGQYVQRQYKRWASQYEYTRDAIANPSLDALIEWIPDNIPEGDETSIVHGDPQIANMIMHPTRNEVAAILDWELSTLGHPVSDFAYFLRPYYIEGNDGFVDIGHAAVGLPSLDDVVAQYCQRTQRDHIEGWDFYVVFNLFRLGAIIQGIAKRVKDGTAASAHAESQVEGAVKLADRAWDIVRELK